MVRDRTQRIPPKVLQGAARMLRVLSHPDRLRMVEVLNQQPVPVGRLAEMIGLSQAAVSQHLTNMAAHGIVARRRDGRSVLYEVINRNALVLLDCLRRHGTGV